VALLFSLSIAALSESHPSPAGKWTRQSDSGCLSSQVQCQENEKVSLHYVK